MADDIFNRLHIIGPPEEVQKVLAAIRGDKDCDGRPALMDFNRIMPIPEDLNIECSSSTYNGMWLFQKMAENKIEQALCIWL